MPLKLPSWSLVQKLLPFKKTPLLTGAKTQKLLTASKADSYEKLAEAMAILHGLIPKKGHDALHFTHIKNATRYHLPRQRGELHPTYTENQLNSIYLREAATGYMRPSSYKEMETFRGQFAALNAIDLNKQLFELTKREAKLLLPNNAGVLRQSSSNIKSKWTNAKVLKEILPQLPSLSKQPAIKPIESHVKTIEGKEFVLLRPKYRNNADWAQANNGIQIKPRILSREQTRQFHNKWIRWFWKEQAINGPLGPTKYTNGSNQHGAFSKVDVAASSYQYSTRLNTIGLPNVDPGPKRQI